MVSKDVECRWWASWGARDCLVHEEQVGWKGDCSAVAFHCGHSKLFESIKVTAPQLLCFVMPLWDLQAGYI